METKVQTIADFLLERFVEDEAAASQVTRWSKIVGDDGHLCIVQENIQEHVLADLAAKRRIVELHEILTQQGVPPMAMGPLGIGEPRTMYACAVCGYDVDCSEPAWDDDPNGCDTLRAVAQPYAGHPGFREEWRV